MTPTPVALFAYARPEHTRRTLEALAQNLLADQTVLHAFCDGPRSDQVSGRCEETRQIIREATGFEKVVLHLSETNKGLANSIIHGVTELLRQHPSVIVVEDDLVSADGFLEFMNEGLERYRLSPKVFTVCGYSHPPSLMPVPSDYPYDAYFSYRNMSWGWATWADRWDQADWSVSDFDAFRKDRQAQARFNRGGQDMTAMLFDQMEGRIDSWAIRWSYTHFKHDALALLPVRSFIHNIGADSSGTHFSTSTDKFSVDLSQAKKVERWPDRIEVDPKIAKSFANAYKRSWKRGLRKVVKLVRRRPS